MAELFSAPFCLQTFLTAAEIFANEIIERIDDREDNGKVRFIALGMVDTDVYPAVFTWRGETSSASSAPRKRAEMKEKSTIVRHSLSQVRAMRERSGDKTSPDGTEAGSLGADFWNSARVVMPGARFPFTFASTMMWWNGSRPMEKGHLTRMNAVLKAYVDGQKC